MYQTSTLRGLPPHELEALAKAHDGVARGLRAAAERRAGEISRELDAAAMIKNLSDLPHQAERMAWRVNVPPGAAAQQIGAETGVPVETVAYHMARRGKELEMLARAKRDRQIVQLARKGWSNAEIGSKVGLHPSTISRIVQAQLREN